MDDREPERGEVSVKLILYTKEGTITAHEPLLASVEITNLTSDELLLQRTYGPVLSTAWQVQNGEGEAVAATPKDVGGLIDIMIVPLGLEALETSSPPGRLNKLVKA